MTLTEEKRTFLARLADGLFVNLVGSGRLCDFVLNPQNTCEALIALHFMECDDLGPWFSIRRYRDAMKTLDDETLTNVLTYLDSMGIIIHGVYMASLLDTRFLDAGEAFLAGEIVDECIYSFRDFLEV